MIVRGYPVYNYKTCPYDIYDKIPYYPRKRSRRDPVRYRALLCTFDIETSNLGEDDQSFMYVWQAAINQTVVTGRSWKEFKRFIYNLTRTMPEDSRVIFFVHNLSFEFQFLRSVLPFADDSVFLPSGRKVLRAISGKVEFRCSYLLSNLSLDEYTRKWGVDYKKVKGFDYRKIRYPWTPLSDFEMEYIVGDVIGLSQAISKDLNFEGDTFDTVPFTSTGFVRRVLKRNMKLFPMDALIKMQPSLYVFLMLNEAMRGGNCHGNRFYAGMIVEDADKIDRSSSYPASQCIEDHYPMGPWKIETKTQNMRYVLGIIKRHSRCFVARIAIWDLRLKDPQWGCPYLSRDKCRNIYVKDLRAREHMWDNGRILYADYLETTITDVDLRIIMDEYDFSNIEFQEMASCRAGKLPAPWIRTNIDYYRAKTELKGVEGQENLYRNSKEKLNAIFGDTVQNPCRVRMVYRHGQYVPDDRPLEAILDEYQRYPYKSFAWGVWCTAWSRYRLEEMIRMAHNAVDPDTGDRFNGFVYTDTDSVVYLGVIPELDAYNAAWRQRAENSGYTYVDADGVEHLVNCTAVDPKGRRHYMGEFEADGFYKRFKTMGAKKYAGVHEDGSLEITIAGVNKKAGAEEMRCLKRMEVGFTFKDAGGLEAVYNDLPYGSVNVDGHRLRIGTNVCLKPSTYTIGLAQDYQRILSDPELHLAIFNEKVYSIM